MNQGEEKQCYKKNQKLCNSDFKSVFTFNSVLFCTAIKLHVLYKGLLIQKKICCVNVSKAER